MAAVVAKEQCLALRAGSAYERVTVLNVNKGTARVQYADKEVRTVPFAHLWKQKKKKSKRASRFFKPTSDKYVPRTRAQRFAHTRRLAVEPVCFE